MPLRVLLVRPWHVVAALLVTLALLLIRIEPAQAALGFAVTLNDTAASANTDASMTVTLETDLPRGGTITITFPAGWTVANGAITAINTAGFAAAPTS
jgi:hypothetical protein